jgi:hypothetical protein
MVATEEFSLTRFEGDQDKPTAVYARVAAGAGCSAGGAPGLG